MMDRGRDSDVDKDLIWEINKSDGNIDIDSNINGNII